MAVLIAVWGFVFRMLVMFVVRIRFGAAVMVLVIGVGVADVGLVSEGVLVCEGRVVRGDAGSLDNVDRNGDPREGAPIFAKVPHGIVRCLRCAQLKCYQAETC